MNGNKVIFDLGCTKHGQPLRLELHSDGSFDLIREAANQRDEPAFIRGLSRDQIAKIGRAAHTEVGAL